MGAAREKEERGRGLSWKWKERRGVSPVRPIVATVGVVSSVTMDNVDELLNQGGNDSRSEIDASL